MAFDDLLRSGIALANSLTESLQVSVTHEAWTGKDTYGKPTYAAGITRSAIVEHVQRWLRTRDSSVLVVEPKVTIIEPITANGATGRKEPVDPRDRITLSDGRVLTQLKVEFILDPDTGYPYMFEITGEV